MKKVLFLFPAITFLLSCGQNQEQEMPEEPYTMPCGCKDEWIVQQSTCKDDPVWDYPVKPSTGEWEQLRTVEERRAVCQIPEDILSSLSTEDLTDICMQYPLLIADFTGSVRDRALDLLFENFNGVRELFQREDASKGLLKWYRCAIQNFSFLDSDASDIEKGRFTYKILIAELLLSKAPDDADYVEMVRLLVCSREKMPEYPESFGLYSWDYNCFARAKIMLKINERIIDEIPQGFENPFFTNFPYNEDKQGNIAYKQARIAIDKLSCRFID
ncbi:MAG: hypothetical protein LBC19_04025 [Tannerella sp.]|jgi:hypothetical protein|nr:hypothetical protein [Tannerella sp.]